MDSGSSKVTQTNKMEPAPQLAPYLAPFMQQASAVAMTPYQQYGGQRVAGFNPDQQTGFGMVRDAASQGAANINNAAGQLNQTVSGDYLGYKPANTQVGQNALLGMNNPYLQSAIDHAQGDVTRQFGNSVFNNTDAMMARSGAFGGSAWRQAQAENARQMSQELGRVSSDMRMADYGLQAQLGEGDLNRRLSASQFDQSLNDAAYQNERQRQLASAGMLPGLNQAGFQNAMAMLGIGDAQQAHTQAGLDTQYQDWLAKQQHPQQSLDTMGNAIRTIMGTGGTQTSTGPNPNQSNPLATGLGLASSGAGLFGALGGLGGAGASGIMGAGMAANAMAAPSLVGATWGPTFRF